MRNTILPKNADVATIRDLAASVEEPNEIAEVEKEHRMSLKCKSCGRFFDSTFTVEEFASLPTDQTEVGTLHLCPSCGALAIYHLKDYVEPSS